MSNKIEADRILIIENDREILENFVIDNVELERIEELTSQFNIFQALNIAEWEVRHSSFLAWLMDPSETHGLDDYFLKSSCSGCRH